MPSPRVSCFTVSFSSKSVDSCLRLSSSYCRVWHTQTQCHGVKLQVFVVVVVVFVSFWSNLWIELIRVPTSLFSLKSLLDYSGFSELFCQTMVWSSLNVKSVKFFSLCLIRYNMAVLDFIATDEGYSCCRAAY